MYKSDCKHFLAYIPCKPHKQYGVHCDDCEYYSKSVGRVLIIKLGAIGDVIRTTPLITKINKELPGYEIWWLTLTPDILPSSVNKKLSFNLKDILILEETEFDWVINLDKDYEACSILNRIKAKKKDGFYLKDGKTAPINKRAEHKFLTGLFDDLNQKNKKSYPQEIFEICGWKFKNEDYLLDVEAKQWNIESYGKKIVGLNTGCGDRWISRLWPDEYWIELISKLDKEGYYPLLLGGKNEHEKNLYFAEHTEAVYLGHFSLKEFISLVNNCDLVVSAVTMAMHLAIGLKKPLVLLNNIFNRYEFELYGRGEIIEPDKKCKCFFQNSCTNEDYNCMNHLSVEKIFNSIKRSLK